MSRAQRALWVAYMLLIQCIQILGMNGPILYSPFYRWTFYPFIIIQCSMLLHFHSFHTGNNIMDSESCLNLNFSLDLPSPARIELDHQVTRFEMTNITLGWKIFPHQSACNVSRILSHPPCEQDNIILNITTFDTKITLSPENAYISNQLADFNLSTFSYQSSEECPALIDSIRINGKYSNCKII